MTIACIFPFEHEWKVIIPKLDFAKEPPFQFQVMDLLTSFLSIHSHMSDSINDKIKKIKLRNFIPNNCVFRKIYSIDDKWVTFWKIWINE